VRTADASAKLDASADRTQLHANGLDLAYVSVAVEDAKGTLVPRAKPRVKFEVTGPADVIATDNGDATSFEPFQSAEHSAFNGRVLGIVRTKSGKPGKITVKVTSEGLAPATVTLESK
jgi:beta-galactosidase